jgi:hypothetical protein
MKNITIRVRVPVPVTSARFDLDRDYRKRNYETMTAVAENWMEMNHSHQIYEVSTHKHVCEGI